MYQTLYFHSGNGNGNCLGSKKEQEEKLQVYHSSTQVVGALTRQYSNTWVYPGSGRGDVRPAKGRARALYYLAPGVLVVGGTSEAREREGSSQVFARGGVD